MSIPMENRIVEHYILIYDPSHPRAYPSGYVAEHILVAEEHLGRPLFDDEEVQHINAKPHDNRPENLRITSGSYKSVFLTEEIEQGSRNSRRYIPCRFQKVCWDTVRAPKARKYKIYLPFICNYQTEGDIYQCGIFWKFREGESTIDIPATGTSTDDL